VFRGASEIAGDGVDGNCLGGDGVARPPAPSSRARGTARGRDVLILSLDSLRWDIGGELRATRAALGPVAELTRAVSAAPATADSVPATLRGRPRRELVFEVSRDPSPTLGTVVQRSGYRAVSVPTSGKIGPTTGVLSGFELLLVPGWTELRNAPFGPAVRRIRQAARDTPGRLLAFLHVMESHYPYRHADGTVMGGMDLAALRGSVRDLDGALAALVRDFRRARGADPIVAVLGDHGEEFGEHGEQYHATSVHAEHVRVVLWLAGPGVPEGRYDAPVSTTALPATVLDLLGIDVPASMTEPSMLPALHGEAPWPELAVSEAVNGTRRLVAYTGRPYRLVSDVVHGVDLLFDVDRDPREQHDLSRRRPAELARMRRLARRWDESH
jgi:hypothetical protein